MSRAPAANHSPLNSCSNVLLLKVLPSVSFKSKGADAKLATRQKL